ncbi:MAG: ATP-binding protein [Firmicutes bacterium]|nr:ATP-binding protein [Bacillota bacterium]
MMKTPYGISSFKTLREEGYLYIDKTKYIEVLENLNSKYLFFIRPRRFGKSLFLSTLAHYYDMRFKQAFDRLFGGLYIGENPTKLRNDYFVLELDFSALNTESKAALERTFKLRLIDSITGFLNKYSEFFADISALQDRMKEMADVGSILGALLESVKKTDKKIYLIIDEYDHFANDIIAMGDGAFYKEIVRAAGFVRDFYEAVKIGTKSVIDRIFITGISPVMLDDLTSGFNIAANLTMHMAVNEMLGFTEGEVEGIIDKADYNGDKGILLDELRENYNGYLFHKDAKQRVYNPDMILHFFNELDMTGKYPEELIDDNVKTDYGRLNRLVGNEQNKKVLDEIIMNEGIVTEIVTRFSFDRMYDQGYFVSLLFYMGLLTIQGTAYGKTKLGIPNYVVKTLFWEYFQRKLREQFNIQYKTVQLAKANWEIAFDGTLKPFLDFIGSNVLKALSNRDLIQFDEKYLKVILFAYLTTSNLYRPISEKEVETGYIDIYLEKDFRMPDVKYEWIIELKYLKKDEKGKMGRLKEEGRRQLEKYMKSREFAEKDNVKKALIIFSGKDEYVVEEA